MLEILVVGSILFPFEVSILGASYFLAFGFEVPGTVIVTAEIVFFFTFSDFFPRNNILLYRFWISSVFVWHICIILADTL